MAGEALLAGCGATRKVSSPLNLTSEENQSATPTATPEVPQPTFTVQKVDWPTVTATEVVRPAENTATPTPYPVIPLSTPDEAEIPGRKKRILRTETASPTATATPTSKEAFDNLSRQFIWRGDINKPKVAVTIDDGWWEGPIVKITEVLKEMGVKLTFFIPGQAINAFPKLWRGLDGLGCKFECHSYSHSFGMEKFTVEQLLGEIDRSQAALDQVLGRHEPFSFYRPVGGTINENIVRALKMRNLRGVIWTLSGEGTSKIATSETITKIILAKAGNGFITLHHFNDADAGALKPIIQGLAAKGLTTTRLDEIL
jgi:peptidoglycan/xylan/chitin deacetylase (PgdA/CDA1 family)